MTSETEPAEGDFHARTIERIQRIMIAIAIMGLAAVGVFFGWRVGLGFAVGAALAFLNFHWLKRVVAGLAELTVQSGSPASSRGVILRFLMRYFLMALIAFVILLVSRNSLYGFFAGLCLPVPAMLCEAAYVTYRVVRGQ